MINRPGLAGAIMQTRLNHEGSFNHVNLADQTCRMLGGHGDDGGGGGGCAGGGDGGGVGGVVVGGWR